MSTSDSKPFDSFASDYRKIHDSRLPPGVTSMDFFRQRADWAARLLEQIHQEKRRDLHVLDFGCSVGSLCEDLARRPHVASVSGVDESQKSCEVAAETLGKQEIPCEFKTKIGDLKTKQFDLITAYNVFHHIEPPHRQAAATEIANSLAPGGQLCVWENNPLNPMTRFLVKICPFDEGVRLLRMKEALKYWVDLGLEVLSKGYVNIVPPKLHRFSMIQAMESSLSKLPVGTQYRIVFQKKPI